MDHLRSQMSALGHSMDGLRSEIQALSGELRGEMHALRVELRQDFADLRADMDRRVTWLTGILVVGLVGVIGALVGAR